jgi:hypothetical protein
VATSAGGGVCGATRSIPLVVPALTEYIGLCRSSNGRLLKSHELLAPQLDGCVVGVLAILELGVLLLDVIPVVPARRNGGRTLLSFKSEMAVAERWY